jgi:pyridoxamine 5'-phosphate oxidase
MDSFSRHTDYGSAGIDAATINPDPMQEFAEWLQAAEGADLFEPNAMVVSTVDPDGAPSARTVLLKGLTAHGFEFVTNYGSRKGAALLEEARVSLLFPWYALKRQVIVDGVATRMTTAESDALFADRPHDSQVASAASRQSQPIESREALEARVRALAEAHPQQVARPESWGGYRVVPTRIEFWQGRTSRLHDRIRFTRVGANWTTERLQP